MSGSSVHDGASSLTSTAERKLLDQLQDFVRDESKKSIFAIGGAIPIDHDPAAGHRPASPASNRSVASADAEDNEPASPTDSASITSADAEDNEPAPPTDSASVTSVEAEDEETADVTQTIEPENGLCSLPVVIRWDTQQEETRKPDGVTSRAQLPPADPDDTSDLIHLVDACQPASFGRGQVDVYDESYRKAGKLDSTAFSTNFNPYEFGIIDSIAKMLLPSILGGSDARLACSRGIRAELYKLNVYSAPSGKFKPHVDTPRSPAQFGSLVVCLPSQHQGGQLVVRHHGEEIVFDWSTEDSEEESCNTIAPPSHALQWAAFYSDCEHEVLEVTEGHRITLTYNLYVVSRGIPSGLSSMDPEALPICQLFKDMLAQPGFLSKGAILGFNCTHAYAHTNKARATSGDIHSSLKGIDMAIYVALRAVGLEVHLRPAIDDAKDIGNFGFANDDDEYMSFSMWSRLLRKKGEETREWDWQRWGYLESWVDKDGNVVRDPSAKEWTKEEYDWQTNRTKEVVVHDTDDDVALRLREIDWYRQFRASQTATFVGKKLWPFSSSEYSLGESDATIVDVLTEWGGNRWTRQSKGKTGLQSKREPSDDFKGFHQEHPGPRWEKNAYLPYDFVHVQWMNEPIHREPAMSHNTYGNESNHDTKYSRLAIFARVPPFFERLSGHGDPSEHAEQLDTTT